MKHELITDRLVLRELRSTDAEDLRRICTQPFVLKWMPDWEMPLPELEKLIEWYVWCYANPGSMRIMLALTLKQDGKMIGLVGTGRKPEVDDDVELMYFIDEEFARQGYMSEAAKALADHALDCLDVAHLIGIAEPENPASVRTMERAGFQRCGMRSILNSGEEEPKDFIYFRREKTR